MSIAVIKCQHFKDSMSSQDFPYVASNVHLEALDEFVDVDFADLQQTNSPSPKKTTNHKKKIRRKRKSNCVFSVTGDSGSGKTSLLQFWADQRILKNRAYVSMKASPVQTKEFVFFYGVKSSADSPLSKMLGKLESSLKSHFQLRELMVRKSPAHRRWDLVRYLEGAALKSRAPIIIVIDGLSRLKMESGVEADPMLWLPRNLPNKVRFIVSLTEYEVLPVEKDEKSPRKKTASFVELERRDTPSIRLGVLSLATRRTILSAYAKYHRSSFDLSNDKVMQILASESSGHPLYLRVLLNSLRTAARLSCIPAIAVGTLIDSVMEGELQGWPTMNDDQRAENLDDSRPTSKDSRPEKVVTPLTWEERQVTMSRGSSNAADQEVAGLLKTERGIDLSGSLTPQQQNILLFHTYGAQPSAVEMVIALALKRCEEDVEMELDGSDKGLLGQVLSLLYVSHHGLTENELLGCVALASRESLKSSEQKRNDRGEWHKSFQHKFEQHRETLRLILDDICMVVRAVDPSVADVVAGSDLSLVDPNEVRIIMEHESVRRVVWKQYLGSSPAERDRNHDILAKYFENVVPVCPRRVEELPWHYEKLQEYGKLRDTVTNVDMFRLWWSDSRMEFYRPELIRVWSVLTLPPIGLDLVEEIRAAFETQIMARHMRDDAISVLMLQVAELTVAFQRAGWENSIDCPEQRHPAIPLLYLVQSGISVLQPDPEGEESGESRQFVELVKNSRHNLDDGPLPSVNHETVEFVGEHYYYSRWMWTQYPLILLGFADMYTHRVAAMAAAKSSAVSSSENGKSSPIKKDPIITRLRHLANKLENENHDSDPVDKKKKKKKKNIEPQTPKKVVQEVDDGEDTKSKTPKSKARKKETTRMSPNLAQKSRPHPNSPFILDVHSGDRHEKRLEKMTQSIMKQRRLLNAMLIAGRGKEKELAIKRDELTILNGLSKGESISLESALKLVSELEAVAKRTNEVETLSNFYRNILQLCKAYGANQPEWLQVLDDDIERSRRKQIATKELIKAVIEQRREILSLLNEARTTHFRRRGVLSQMLDRLEFQHARELENVNNEKQWKKRQEMMLRDDIVHENRLKLQRAEDERKAAEEHNQARLQARNDKLAVWRSRIQRLKDATGVSTIEEMLQIISSRSQLTTEKNLTVLVTDQEKKIASLTLQKEQLRNEMMKLRFSYNKANSRDILSTSPNGNTSEPSPQKKELHHIAEKEMSVQRVRAQVEHTRRELTHVNSVVMNIKVGLEHITRMCGVNFDDAEKIREVESKKKKLYFVPSNEFNGKERAEATISLLAKVEAKLVGKIADLQRLAPRTPTSRDRKRRRRLSKSRDGRRRSHSRDGRVGSPLSRESRVTTALSPLNLRTISRGSSTGNSSDNRPGSRQSRPLTQETLLSRTASRGSSIENLMRPLSRQLNSRQGSFRGSRPSTQGSMDMIRPDTPETDEDSNASSQQQNIRRWRKMWPKIVQTNDAAILKAKAMAKNLGSIGKDLSEVQSSLWKNKANKNMSRMETLSSLGPGGNRETGGFGIKGGGKIFVNLEALNRPMSADISGTGLAVPIVSFKREGGFSMSKKRQLRHDQHRYHQQHQEQQQMFCSSQGEEKEQDFNKKSPSYRDLRTNQSAIEEEEVDGEMTTRADLKRRNQLAIMRIERQRIKEEEEEKALMEDFF